MGMAISVIVWSMFSLLVFLFLLTVWAYVKPLVRRLAIALDTQHKSRTPAEEPHCVSGENILIDHSQKMTAKDPNSILEQPISLNQFLSPSVHPAENETKLSPIQFSPSDVVALRYREHGIRLYHFTDNSNVSSITSRGWLFPRYLVEQQRMSVYYVSSPQSRDTDTRKGLDEYVHVGFHPEHKMSYSARARTQNGICLFEISTRVLNRPGVKVMKGLANRNDLEWQSPEEFKEEDLIRIARGDDETRYWQAIIPGAIYSKDFQLVSPYRPNEGHGSYNGYQTSVPTGRHPTIH